MVATAIVIIGGVSNMNKLHTQIIRCFIGTVPPNVIYKTLRDFGVGVRKQDFFDKIREIKKVKFDVEEAKLLHTPIKYLTEEQKMEKYCLLYDKMVDKSFKRGRIENRKAARQFMKTDNYDEDRDLIPSEKVEDAYNEMTRFLKYETEVK